MNLDGLSLSLGMLSIPFLLIGMFYFVAYLKNLGRYPMPRYLPREDEILWARFNANSERMWGLMRDGMQCANWDLGHFYATLDTTIKCNTIPTVNDVIVVPKRWGGYHALIITSANLEGYRYQVYAVYLGEYKNGKVQSGRSGVRHGSL